MDANRVQLAEQQASYNSVSFALPMSSTDYDVKVNQANSFVNQALVNYVRLTTDQTITVKFNSTSNPWISITSSESPFIIDKLQVSNIYLTNSTVTSNIKILSSY